MFKHTNTGIQMQSALTDKKQIHYTLYKADLMVCIALMQQEKQCLCLLLGFDGRVTTSAPCVILRCVSCWSLP